MASKTKSSFINMVLTLLIVPGIAALALGSIYNVTLDPINKAKAEKKEAALNLVVPAFDEVKTYMVKPEDSEDSIEFNDVYSNGVLVGTAIETYTDKGFSGRFTIMVGFDTTGTIVDVVHLEHKETPGLGDKMEKDKDTWSDQFKDKNPLDFSLLVTKDGGDVDAITAATITSRAFCDAVQRAFDTYQKHGGKSE